MTKTGLYGTSISPLFLRPNGVSICGYLFLCLNTAFFQYFLADEQAIYNRMTWEDSWIENLTAVWLLLGGLLLLATALVERDTLRRRVCILGYIALIFVAGEEISWGQRIFDFPTPRILYEVNSQGEFNLHNIGRFRDILHVILPSGTLLLCLIVIAAFLCGKESVFRIPLPSTLLTFGFLASLGYGYSANLGEYLFRGTGTIWFLLLVFLLFFRQYELLFATLTTTIITLTLVVVDWTDFSSASRLRYDEEIEEYLIAFGCFWYSLELFVAQKSLRGGGGEFDGRSG